MARSSQADSKYKWKSRESGKSGKVSGKVAEVSGK
jgi:hypothetical protein